MAAEGRIRRGQVWEVELEPVRGSEIGKRRPCLVVTNDVANRSSPVIAIVAITSRAPKRDYPFMVEIPQEAGMARKSWVTCAHIRTVSKERLGSYRVSLDAQTISRVDRALAIQLGLDPNLKSRQPNS